MTTLTKKKSLREFSLTTKSVKGDSLKILISYDMTVGNGGVSLGVAVNGNPVSYTKRDLRRVKALKNPLLDKIMVATTMDSAGCEKGLYETTLRLTKELVLTNSSSARDELRKLYSITTPQQEKSLNTMVRNYSQKSDSSNCTNKALEGIVRRYMNAQRLRLLENAREIVQLVRGIYRKGIEINGTHSSVELEGWLKENHYPSYYKRDIDYIRKTRERIFWNVLNKEYTPVK